MTDLKTVERDRAGLTRSRILVFYHFRPGCARLSFYARGGGALCVAALGAEGISRVTGLHHIRRGYASLAGDLRALGADIRERR